MKLVQKMWAADEMVCRGCGCDEGVHIWLVGSEPVECPECGEMLMVPKDAEEVRD